MRKIFMDIHTHVLPGVDDGSDSMEETIRMIGQACKEGIRAMIATPHYGIMNDNYKDSEAYDILIEVIKIAKASFPEMNFLMGNEIYYSPGIADDLLEGKARCLGSSNYALVEFGTGVDFETIRKALEEFRFNGFRMIIAHLERYECLKNNVQLVQELVDNGAFVQLNCRSITGGGFELENRARWCRKLIENGLVHFIASDCHDSVHRSPTFRNAVEKLIKYVGEEKTEKIVKGNIICLIKNEKIN